MTKVLNLRPVVQILLLDFGGFVVVKLHFLHAYSCREIISLDLCISHFALLAKLSLHYSYYFIHPNITLINLNTHHTVYTKHCQNDKVLNNTYLVSNTSNKSKVLKVTFG